MKLTPIDYTGAGTPDPDVYAQNVLICAKDTRLMTAPAMAEVEAMSAEDRAEQISAIARTIPSSWEFVHYSVLVEGVTRAFSHQLVRSRHLSFAQQTLRTVDVSAEYAFGEPAGLGSAAQKDYQLAMLDGGGAYARLVKMGVKPEDARNVLPIGTLTNILVGGNLRAFVELVRRRSSPRVQGEYRDFTRLLQATIVGVHPFTEEFFRLDWGAVQGELEGELEGLEPDRAQRIMKLAHKMTGF